MLTICWAAKGGSGTTVATAGCALSSSTPSLLVDLAGGLPLALGVPAPATPGVAQWLAAEAPPGRLANLEVPLRSSLSLLPWGHPTSDVDEPLDGDRWRLLAEHLRNDPRHVVVDAGTRRPPAALLRAAGQALLVTRNCFLALHAAVCAPDRPTGVVLVEEPGRRLGADDVEHSLGAPVVAIVLLDPAVARAVDAGLLLGRLPTTLRRPLGPLGTAEQAAA